MQREGEYRNFYRGLVREVLAIAEKMGIDMEGFSEKDSLAVVDRLAKEMTTSFQKDVAAGKKSEVGWSDLRGAAPRKALRGRDTLLR